MTQIPFKTPVSASCNYMALSRVVSEIFNVQNVVTLKSGSKVTQGHWEWYHSTCVSFPISVLYSNFVPKTHRFFRYYATSKMPWRRKPSYFQWPRRTYRVDPSRSLEISPFDRAHTTSYWRSIVISMALSRVVSEIFNVEKCLDLEIEVRGHSRSLRVVPFGRSCMVSY